MSKRKSESPTSSRPAKSCKNGDCAGCGKPSATVPLDDERFVERQRYVCNQDCLGALIRKTQAKFEEKKKDAGCCAQCRTAKPSVEHRCDGKDFCSHACLVAYTETCPQCGVRIRGSVRWLCNQCQLCWNVCRTHQYKNFASRVSTGEVSPPDPCHCVARGAAPSTDERIGFLLLKLKETRGASWEEDHLALLLAHFGQTREESEAQYRAWLNTPDDESMR